MSSPSRRRLVSRELDWRVIDRALALALVAAVVVELSLKTHVHGPRGLSMALYAVPALSLLVRRSWPLLPISLLAVAGIVGQAVLVGPPDTTSVILLLIASCYSAGAHGRQRIALIGLAIAIMVVVVVTAERGEADLAFPTVFFVFLPWLIGRTLRHQGALSRELAENADRAEQARAEEERSAVLGERARIARDLHDVLAHNLSVMVVQAGAGRRVLQRDQDAAAGAADLIRVTGREALAELRTLLGTMHRDEGEPLHGVPSLGAIERLIGRAREAGLVVALEIEGEPAQLPTGVDLTAYRVVQEALTNTLKHAGQARARVTVRYEIGEVIVDVEDDGAAANTHAGLAPVGGGLGLVGMRERVAVYGGEIEAGAREGGGFRVVARLPVEGGRVTA